MSVALLGERRHRHNQRVAELRRLGFPKIGHCDIWLIEELQDLHLLNRGVILYPEVTNSSQYIETNESFDAVALQSTVVHDALKERCKIIESEKGALPTLSRDLAFLCKSTGSPLPFLPFSGADERIKFSEYANDNNQIDNSAAAIHWNRTIVDGVKLMPKLPVHIRTHRDRYRRSRRIRAMHQKTKNACKKLSTINEITYNSAQTLNPTGPAGEAAAQGTEDLTTLTGTGFAQIPLPPAFTLPDLMSLHPAPYSRVHASTIGEVPQPPTKKRKERSDKGKQRNKLKPRRCMGCVRNGGQHYDTCSGRFPRGKCQFFNIISSKVLSPYGSHFKIKMCR